MSDFTNRKFQWSKMSADRSEQVVVRCDTFDELTEAIDLVKTVLPEPGTVNAPKQGQFPEDEPGTPIASQGKNPPICSIHGTPMKFRSGISKKTGKPYGFWSCGRKLENGDWCPEKK